MNLAARMWECINIYVYLEGDCIAIVYMMGMDGLYAWLLQQDVDQVLNHINVALMVDYLWVKDGFLMW